MALAVQDFIHEFFSAKSIASGSGTINWASAEGTPADYESAATEKVMDAVIAIIATFNASDTDNLQVHIRYKAGTILKTYALTIEAPGSTTPQQVEYKIPGLVKDIDMGFEHDGSTYAISVDADIVDGTKLTGVTAAV